MQKLLKECRQTGNGELIADTKKAGGLAISDWMKVYLIRCLLHNFKNKEAGGSGDFMIPHWPDYPADKQFLEGEFTVLLKFICELIQNSRNCMAGGNTILTVLSFCLEEQLKAGVPCIIIYQRTSAVLAMVYIVACCISEKDLNKERVSIVDVAEHSELECPSASRCGDGVPPPTTTRRSEVEEAAFVKHMRAVFDAFYCKGAAEIAVLTHYLSRANAFGHESMDIRFPEINAALGRYGYNNPDEMYAAVFAMRHDPSAYKVAAHLFVGCFYGLMVGMLFSFLFATSFDRALAQLPPYEHVYSSFFATGCE